MSLFKQMEQIEVGKYLFLETEDYRTTQRRVTSRTRYPAHMADNVYSCEAYNAVSAANIEKNVMLVKVTRLR